LYDHGVISPHQDGFDVVESAYFNYTGFWYRTTHRILVDYRAPKVKAITNRATVSQRPTTVIYKPNPLFVSPKASQLEAEAFPWATADIPMASPPAIPAPNRKKGSAFEAAILCMSINHRIVWVSGLRENKQQEAGRLGFE